MSKQAAFICFNFACFSTIVQTRKIDFLKMQSVHIYPQRSGVIFHAYASAHNKLESVGPTLESKMAPSKEGEHGGKRDNSGR